MENGEWRELNNINKKVIYIFNKKRCLLNWLSLFCHSPTAPTTLTSHHTPRHQIVFPPPPGKCREKVGEMATYIKTIYLIFIYIYIYINNLVEKKHHHSITIFTIQYSSTLLSYSCALPHTLVINASRIIAWIPLLVLGVGGWWTYSHLVFKTGSNWKVGL